MKKLVIWLAIVSAPALAQTSPPDLTPTIEVPTGSPEIDVDLNELGSLPAIQPIPTSQCQSYTEYEVAASRKGLPELVYSDITLSANLNLNNLDSRVEDVIIGCMLFAPNPEPFNLSAVPSSDWLLRGGSVGMAKCKSGDLSTTNIEIPIFVPSNALGSTWGGYACAIWFRTADAEAQAGDKTYSWTRVEGGTDMLIQLMGPFPK